MDLCNKADPVNTIQIINPHWSKKDTETLNSISLKHPNVSEAAKEALDTFPERTYTDIHIKIQRLVSKKNPDTYKKISLSEKDIKHLENNLFQNTCINIVIEKTALEIKKKPDIVRSKIFQNMHFFDILGLRVSKEEPARTASPVKRKISDDDMLDSSTPKRITPSSAFNFLNLEDIEIDDEFLRSLEPSPFEKTPDPKIKPTSATFDFSNLEDIEIDDAFLQSLEPSLSEKTPDPKIKPTSPTFDFSNLEEIDKEIEHDAFLQSLDPSLFEKISDTDSPLLEK